MNKLGIMNLTTSQLRTDRIRPKVDMLCLMTGIWYQ